MTRGTVRWIDIRSESVPRYSGDPLNFKNTGCRNTPPLRKRLCCYAELFRQRGKIAVSLAHGVNRLLKCCVTHAIQRKYCFT